jgi:galactokinase
MTEPVVGRDALVALAEQEFFTRTGRRPQWRWHVPGRIEIFGKHTDYAGGESLLATVPRGFAVVASPREDADLRVIDARHHDEVLIPATDTEARRGWVNYAAVTVRRLANNFPGIALGTDIAIASDLPRAAGVSSSSALVVGLATALIRRSGVDQRADWRSAITSPEDLAWYLGCVENGLSYKALAGTSGVGTHGGSQDHTAILACKADRVSHFGFMPVRRVSDTPMPPDWTFVILSSGVHADKAGSVRDRYNRASIAVRGLLSIWQAETGSHNPSLSAALGSAPDAEHHLREALARHTVPDFTPADLDRRLTQLSRELARVPLAARAFARADRDTIGALTRASQADAEQLLGNQIPETCALARMAYDHGAFAASGFGAGFGGSVWALAPTDRAETFAARWRQAYVDECRPTGVVESFTCRPGAAVTELEG